MKSSLSNSIASSSTSNRTSCLWEISLSQMVPFQIVLKVTFCTRAQSLNMLTFPFHCGWTGEVIEGNASGIIYWHLSPTCIQVDKHFVQDLKWVQALYILSRLFVTEYTALKKRHTRKRRCLVKSDTDLPLAATRDTMCPKVTYKTRIRPEETDERALISITKFIFFTLKTSR